MSTFNQFIQNDDAYTDLYTPLLYKEKGMKRGKEQFREFNRMIKQTSRKANEVGSIMQSQTEQIKMALNKFVGTMNPADGINQIGKAINNKLDQINNKISGIKKLEKSQSVINQDTNQNNGGELQDKDKNNKEQEQQNNLQPIHLSSSMSVPNYTKQTSSK